MLPNYRGLLAIIPPAVLRALTSQSAVLRFSRAVILAGLLPVCQVSLDRWLPACHASSASRHDCLSCLCTPTGHSYTIYPHGRDPKAIAGAAP